MPPDVELRTISARTPPLQGGVFRCGVRAPGKVGWLVVFSLTVAGCTSSPDVFEANRKQAVRDSKTPEAQAYEREFYPAIGQDLASLLKKCTTDFPAAETKSFELVFRIDHWGAPKAVLVRPMTDLSGCVATGFWYFKFPHPDEKFAKTGMALLLPISIK